MLLIAATSQSYTKNSYDLKNELKKLNIDKNTMIITADIESLYTNIPQEMGALIVTDTIYETQNKHKPTIKKESFKILLRNLLKNNIFEFINKYYIQKNGTAMGTIMAPTYANIYLKHYEDKWLNTTPLKNNILLFKRYIDDILIIYNNINKDIDLLIMEIKHKIYGPQKLTIEYNNKQLHFLDIIIHLNNHNNHKPKSLYKKPFQHHQLLHYNSNHPKHIISNVPKQALKRIKDYARNTATKDSKAIHY